MSCIDAKAWNQCRSMRCRVGAESRLIKQEKLNIKADTRHSAFKGNEEDPAIGFLHVMLKAPLINEESKYSRNYGLGFAL